MSLTAPRHLSQMPWRKFGQPSTKMKYALPLRYPHSMVASSERSMHGHQLSTGGSLFSFWAIRYILLPRLTKLGQVLDQAAQNVVQNWTMYNIGFLNVIPHTGSRPCPRARHCEDLYFGTLLRLTLFAAPGSKISIIMRSTITKASLLFVLSHLLSSLTMPNFLLMEHAEAILPRRPSPPERLLTFIKAHHIVEHTGLLPGPSLTTSHSPVSQESSSACSVSFVVFWPKAPQPHISLCMSSPGRPVETGPFGR